MSLYTVCSKSDRAIVAFLISQGVSDADHIFPAKRSPDKPINCVIVWSHSAAPLAEGPHSGIFNVETFIEVRTSGVQELTQAEDAAREASDDLWGAVADAFMQFDNGDDQSGNSLGDAIAEAAQASGAADLQDLIIQDVKVIAHTQGFNPRSPLQQGNAWVDALHLTFTFSPPSNG